MMEHKDGASIELVPLSDIEPGNNPRKDFGDITALAEAIDATGGQPVNPIVVARDGDRYRIVDGERRFRALKALNADGGFARCAVFDDWSMAAQAIAMVATDEKLQLSELEMAKGYQGMLMLGVEDDTMAKVLHRPRRDIRKARSIASMPEAEQATLDQMICAAEFEDEDDRKAVLEADSKAYVAKAESIRRRNAERENLRELYECVIELGFEPLDDPPDGYRSIMWCSTANELRRLVKDHEGEELAVWRVAWHSGWWNLGHKVPEYVEPEEHRQERELRERRTAATEALRKKLIEDVASSDVSPSMCAAAGRLRGRWQGEDVSMLRSYYARELDGDDEQAKEMKIRAFERYHLSGPASTFELMLMLRSLMVDWWLWVSELLPAYVEDAGEEGLSEEDWWLLDRAREVRSERERECADDEDDYDDDIEF